MTGDLLEDHLVVLAAEFRETIAEQERLGACSAAAAHDVALRVLERFLDTPEAPQGCSPGPQAYPGG